MTNTQHTPGPWAIGRDGYNPDKIYADQDTVAAVFGLPLHSTIGDVRGDNRWAQGLANARLIAAAPDLLAALQRVVDRATHAKPDSCGQEMRAIRAALVDEARAAIAKATGQ